MKTEFELADILDTCLDELARGRRFSSCLDRFPEHADELRPLLAAAVMMRQTERPVARPEAVKEGQARMLAALQMRSGVAEGRRRYGAAPKVGAEMGRRKFPWWSRFLRISVATMVVVAIILTTLFVRTPLDWIPGQVVPVAAMLAETQGAVEVCPAGAIVCTPAVSGQSLERGDAVHTLLDGWARLVFSDGSVTEMLPETEIVLVELPQASSDVPSGPILYQARGEARHSVPEQSEAWDGELGHDLEVRAPAFTTVATAAAFALEVDQDGGTRLRVSSGRAVARLGAVTRVLAAGDELFAATGGGLPPVERPGQDVRPETPPGQDVRPETPPGQDVRPETPPGQDVRPETPPGQDVRPETPPGQDVRPETPPGQDVRPETPPGQDKRPETPPGQDRRPETPPGQDRRPETPPGQEGKPETPPGQEGKPETPPGQEEKPNTPPGQDVRPETPPGQDVRPETPPGQDRRP